MKVSKKVLKVLSTVLAMLVLTASLGACANNEKEISGNDSTLSFWGVLDTNVAASSIKSYSDLMLYQEMEKITGIHVDFIHPISGSTGNEAFLTMLSGSELPDIIEYN